MIAHTVPPSTKVRGRLGLPILPGNPTPRSAIRSPHVAAFVVAWALSGFAHAASLQLEKTPIILGQTESVGVTIEIDEPDGADVRPLRLAVNVGSFAPVQRLSAGHYKTTYTPPSTKFPQVALVAVWRETGADAPIEFLRIPLLGAAKLPIGARRGAKVSVVVGEQTFGPVVVERDGQVEVPIIVAPGVAEAELRVREPNGNALTKKLPVEVPPYNRLTAALVPHAIVANGENQARLDIHYDRAESGMSASRVKVSASVGAVTFERGTEGRFVYWYRPPAGLGAASVDFTVSVEGDKAAKAQAKLRLGITAPARVVVRPPAKALRADGTSKEPVQVIVLDNEGLGLPDQKVSLSANAADVADLEYKGNGVYEALYTAPSAFPAGGLVQFVAALPAPDGSQLQGVANYLVSASALPKQATFHLAPTPIPADGRTSAELRLDVRDEAGLPLPGAKLLAVASHGTLGPLTDDGEGRYRATYTAPTDIPDGDTLIRVVDTSGAFEQRVTVPMREDPRRFLIGVRGGFVHSLGDLVGPRVGADLSVPLQAGPVLLWFSLVGQAGQATQTVSGASLSTKSDLLFIPVSGRVAGEVFATRRLALQVGVGGGATWARYSTTLTGERTTAWGPSALGFVGATLSVGPGHFFLEAGYTWAPVTWAPVSAVGFRVETGGIGAAAGYRLGIF